MVDQNLTVLSVFIITSILTSSPAPQTKMQKGNGFRILESAEDTHCCTSVLTSCVHADKDLNQKCKIWIHHFIRPDFRFSSCVIWQTSSCSPRFHRKHFWWDFSEQLMDQLKHQRPSCVRSFPFLKDITFRYCSFYVSFWPLLFWSYTYLVSSFFEGHTEESPYWCKNILLFCLSNSVVID